MISIDTHLQMPLVHLIFKALICTFFSISAVFFSILEFPPLIVDNGKNFSGDELKKKQDEAALIVKTCYW